jgi:protein phosphatase
MPDIDFFQLTEAGRVHAHNADGVGRWPHEDGLVFAVAGGVGHQAAGEASAVALDVLPREMDTAPSGWPVAKRLRRAVQQANVAIHAKAITVPELRGMATTLTASALTGGTLVAAHVGDCRLFLLRDGELAQLTKDHTWVWEQAGGGSVSPDNAGGRTLTRSLGRQLVVGIDVLTLPVRAGDVVLQCSRGVHAVLGEAEVAELLAAHPPEPACRALLRRAREEGAEDSLSVQVAAVGALPAAGGRPWWRLGR